MGQGDGPDPGQVQRVSLGPGQLTLAVRTWHPGRAGAPLVVLHGFLEQSLAWRQVAERLDRRVIAPDHRGHGRSDHVGAGGFYHFWDYVADLDQLLDRLCPEGPVDLLGHSMGGTVAALFAGSRPERVRRLVLVEGLGPADDEGAVLARARAFLADRRDPRPQPVFADLPEAAARIRRFNPRLPEPVALELAEGITQPTPGGLTWSWDPLHRARSPRPFVLAHFARFLEAIAAPTLVVSGGDSPHARAERAQHLRQATLHAVPAAGHLVHLDAPDALADAVERFLTRAEV